ncbi:cytochrome P450 [Annulohypoxylon bovei var. microspora]|nr:cytochrome P450 [Annulohypoxylon bovei var. microspora]
MLASVVQPIWFIAFLGFIAGTASVVKYVRDVHEYHQANKKPRKQQLPPKYPAWVPYLGTIAPMLWDFPSFLRRITSYGGQLTSSRIAIGPNCDIFLFQDRSTVKEIWKKSASMCAGKVHVFACRYMFGMSEKTLSRYAADNSGPFAKPYPGSNILPQDRIHRLLAGGIDKALTGSGFGLKLERFRETFMSHIQKLEPTDEKEWIEVEDFHKFAHYTVGASIIQSIFGPSLLRLNPTFMDDLFEFEHWFPLLAKGIPEFILPKPYAVRRRLHSHFKRWYTYAREHFTESSIGPDGDSDPFWGSEWMRQRQEALKNLQDEDSLAAGDLGVAWASLSNIVAASALIVLQVAETPNLVNRVRDEITSDFGQQSLAEIDLKKLSNNPLLASIYAETLRLYVETFTIVSSPIEDVPLGKYWLPKGKLGLVNSAMAHMDNEFWNTKDGLHPLDTFWAERFLTDPKDPSSGPSKIVRREPNYDNPQDTAPYFSLKGLEGSWIPYGGGNLVCPGRFLAKNVMTFACAFLTQEFDIEIITKELKFGSRNYGFGISMPKHAIVVRMKRR